MNRLDLCIPQDGYSVQLGCPVDRIPLTGGFDKYIKSANCKTHTVSVSMLMEKKDQLYFRAFYQNFQLNPNYFVVGLIIEYSDLADYLCIFSQDNVSISNIDGKVFEVSFELIVITTQTRVFTSKPYPFVLEENIKTNLPKISVYLNYAANHTELISTDVGVDSVVLYSPLNVLSNSTQKPEEINGFVGGFDRDNIGTNFLIESVILASGLTSVQVDVEDVGTTVSMGSVVLNQVLITRHVEPESISTSVSIVSVVLTSI